MDKRLTTSSPARAPALPPTIACDYCEAGAVRCVTMGDPRTRRVTCGREECRSRALRQEPGQRDWTWAPGFQDLAWRHFKTYDAFQQALRTVVERARRAEPPRASS